MVSANDVIEHFAFPGNIDFAADDQVIVCESKYHEQFPMQMTHKHNKWLHRLIELQILAQKDFPPKLLWSENADFKFSVNNEGLKEETSTRNRGAEGTSLSTARDRGTGDWNQRHYDRSLSKTHPADICRSKSAKFQLCITARTIIIFRRTAPGQICSLFLSFSNSGRRNNAKSAFQYTVNNNTT